MRNGVFPKAHPSHRCCPSAEPHEQVIASIDAPANTFFVHDPRSGKRADGGVVRDAG